MAVRKLLIGAALFLCVAASGCNCCPFRCCPWFGGNQTACYRNPCAMPRPCGSPYMYRPMAAPMCGPMCGPTCGPMCGPMYSPMYAAPCCESYSPCGGYGYGGCGSCGGGGCGCGSGCGSGGCGGCGCEQGSCGCSSCEGGVPYTGRRVPTEEIETEAPAGEYAAANSEEAST